MIDYSELRREMVNTPPMKRPCIRYAAGPSSDGKDEIYKLRGIRFFELFREQYEIWAEVERATGVEIKGHEAQVYIGSAVKLPPCRDEILFQVMPLPPTDEGVSLYEEYTNTACLVADVTGDVFKIGEWGGDGAGSKAGKTIPITNWEYWYREDIQDRFLRILKMSAVITTSWAELVRPLEILTGRPVIHLPDWHDENEQPFMDTWLQLVMPEVFRQQRILHPEYFKKRSLWKKFVDWFLVRKAGK